MKEFCLLVLTVVLLPVIFPLAVVGGWIFTVDKEKAKQEMQ
jgi:nitrate reductase NapE component